MEEEIKVLENCWVMATDHVLDEGNIALKLAIKNFIKGYRQLEKENKELKNECKTCILREELHEYSTFCEKSLCIECKRNIEYLLGEEK